jgi:hypothetical protein
MAGDSNFQATPVGFADDECMRLESIEPLASLADEQMELLTEMLADHPEIDHQNLVVYWARWGGDRRALVAPVSEGLRPGMAVIAEGWTELSQKVGVLDDRRGALDPGELVEVQLARALVADAELEGPDELD